MAKKITNQDKQKTIEWLKKLIKEDDTIYLILRHVSQSGMARDIDMFIIKDNEPLLIGWKASNLVGERWHKDNYGIRITGCGMDMGFSLVASLAKILFGDYKKLNHYWM